MDICCGYRKITKMSRKSVTQGSFVLEYSKQQLTSTQKAESRGSKDEEAVF